MHDQLACWCEANLKGKTKYIVPRPESRMSQFKLRSCQRRMRTRLRSEVLGENVALEATEGH